MKKKIKILQVGPANREFRTDYYIMKEFKKLGHSVFIYHDAKVYSLIFFLSHCLFRLIASIYKPDIMFCTKANNISLKNLEWSKERFTTIMWYFDIRIPIEQKILDRAKRVDLFYITNYGQIPQFIKEKVNVKYLTQACITVFSSTKKNYLYDVSFIGNNNGGSSMREEILNSIGSYFNLHVWGARWTSNENFTSHPRIFKEVYADVCVQSKIILDIKSYDYCIKVEGNFSNRIPLTLGYGGFLISQYVPGMEDSFKDREHIVYFRTAEEAIRIIRYYLEHKDERAKIAKQGREFALQNYTYKNRVVQILRDAELIEK